MDGGWYIQAVTHYVSDYLHPFSSLMFKGLTYPFFARWNVARGSDEMDTGGFHYGSIVLPCSCY
jgi:hypothetical protein